MALLTKFLAYEGRLVSLTKTNSFSQGSDENVTETPLYTLRPVFHLLNTSKTLRATQVLVNTAVAKVRKQCCRNDMERGSYRCQN